VAGALLILSKAGMLPGDIWDYLFPIALLAFGAKIILDHKKKN
jgi:hypothetical protein